MTSPLCHCPEGPRTGHIHPYLPPLREGELQRYAEALNKAEDLLPPTHPRGPRGIERLIERRPILIGDRCDAEPKPPTERGWTVPPVARIALEARGVPDYSAADRTFENETRLYR